ncbi:MAG: translocation/assembly module TamB [Chitinophaga sp.]|uniref:translocation/assembly module TamB domain-containing protein n=1 Tax=Chitinophaga sp. TaxID=1869181 RepID=UPI0025BF05D3|nr:translocation/assembly module TamB domain-containing protein [Chitinophaga sp.]MBV8254676.1 translocation/assembly module TamB [Chitinophaga sp.]
MTEPEETGENRGRPWWKWLLWIIVAVLLLPVMLLLLLQIDGVQNYIRQQGESYLQKKLNTRIKIGYLRARGWQYLELKDVYVADTTNQPLFYSGTLKVHYNLLSLLSNDLKIDKLEWDSVLVNAYRLNDSTFNYQFAIDAFVKPGPKKDTLNTSTGTTLQYLLKDISLKQFRIRYEDLPGGMDAVLTWKEIHLDPDDLLVEDGVYSFRGIDVDGLKGYFRQYYNPSKVAAAAPPPEPKDTNAVSLHLLLKKLTINNSSFLFSSDAIGISTAWTIGKLTLLNSSLDQDSTHIQVGDLKVQYTGGVVALMPGKDKTPPPPDTTPNTWTVAATQVHLDRLAVRYDNGAPPPKAAGPNPDYNHLFLSNINTHIANVKYSPDTISAALKSMTLHDWSGFTIKKANMDVVFTPQSLSLNNFLVQTNKSTLRKDITVTVPSWADASKDLDKIGLDANLDSITVALGEWLGFVPDARKNKYFNPLWDKELTLSAILKGNLGLLNIRDLYVNDHIGNLIKMSNGQVNHAANPDKLNVNLTGLYIQSGNKPLRAWLPAGTLPDTPRIPEKFQITGSFSGGMKDMNTNVQLRSDYANADIKARLINITDSLRSSYNINIPYMHIHMGKLLLDTTYGWVNGSMSATGQGYTLKGMIARATAQLSDAYYKGYTYHDISVAGDINKGVFRAHGESADTSITATFQVEGALSDTGLQNFHTDMEIAKADLYTTHWYTKPLTLMGNVHAEFTSIDPQRIEGNAFLTQWKIQTADNIIPLDTVALIAKHTDQQYIDLKTPMGVINSWGQFDYTKIGAAFSMIMAKPLQPMDTAKLIIPPAGQSLAWSGSLVWPRSLHDLAPTLRIDEPLVFSGRLNSDSSLLTFQAHAPKINYDSLQVDSLAINVAILDTALQAKASLAHLAHPTFPLHQTMLTARADTGLVNFDLVLHDIRNKPKYQLGGYVDFLPDNIMKLSIKPGLLLNYQQWAVDRDNMLRLKNHFPDSANIRLSQGHQSIHLVTQQDTSATPAVLLKIQDFQLSTITAMLSSDTLLANGLLNADANVRNWNTSPIIDAKLRIDSLTVKNAPVGTLTAQVNNPVPNEYKLDAALSGPDNNVTLTGTYDSTLQAHVAIEKLSMKTVEPFTFGSMHNMYGTASGIFDITGTTAAPKVIGEMHFSQAGGVVSLLGNNLHLPDETIIMDDKGIQFNNVVIADSLNDEMVMTGRINTRDYSRFFFNLDVNADNFMALGPQQNNTQWLYGPAYVDSKIKIRGTLDLPRIDANVTLRDKSNITVILPHDEPGLADREGVVEFVDMSNPIDSALLAKKDSLKYGNPRLRGINFSGNIAVTPASTIKIVIDSQNGDYVQAKGTANIQATLDPSSKMSLTGRYEIEEGKYELSLNQLIKRSFDIQKGSYISFSGDAMDADLNITAKYTVNAPAIDLVQDQLGNMSQEDKNRYKQRIPFEVYLMIKGNLKKPDISFQLDMPERERNDFNGAPYNRIKQINQVPSELNKQVMGLLVLNTFIPDDPTSTLDNSGGGIGQAARNSVSKILSQQLNNLAGNLIKGVDLNFDLQSREDYSTGSAQEQTNLNIGASKNLFNNRLTVSVGSNIMLTGNTQNASSLIGDISVDYKLTKDGRYRVRVYQRNDNQSVIEGQLVETGIAFMLVVDYEEFREIFQRSKTKTEQKKLRTNSQKKSNNKNASDK